jgi:adenylate cyclase
VRERRLGGRRLAAILAADVVGYSRLVRADEEGTIARLRTLRRELIDPAIDAYAGRIIKTTGDGLLLEFASIVDAVRCAVSVQRGMASRNEGAPEERRIVFRVGINLGDVVIEGDGDLMGDGINVASRLEGLAEPGAICVSGAAYEQVRDKLDLPFADSGEQTVKNIDRPVRVYSLSAAAIPALPDQPIISEPKPFGSPASRRLWLVMFGAGAIAVAAAGVWLEIQRSMPSTVITAPPLSIVVLPFANLSGDPQQEYFADAITEDVTTDLSRIQGSFVIARNTAYTYQGNAQDVKKIASELGVRYVLDGGVQRNGSQVRVNAQLIDGKNDQQIWAERFDGDLTNVFELQSRITGKIANSLRQEMIDATASTASQRISPDALDYVYRGRAFRMKPQTRETLAQEQALFEKAIALDGSIPDTWAGLGVALTEEALNFGGANHDAELARAEDALNRALALNPNYPEAHSAHGLILSAQQKWTEAEDEFELLMRLDRNYAYAYSNLALVKIAVGNPAAAIPLCEQAMRLSPRETGLVGLSQLAIGYAHLVMRDDLRAAIDWLEKARGSNPKFPWTHLLLSAAYGLNGDAQKARASMVEARRLNPAYSIHFIKSWEVYNFSQISAPFYDVWRQAGMPEQ